MLTTAANAMLIQPGTAQFWQIVTAMGLTVTPLLGWLGRRLARRVDVAAIPRAGEHNGSPRTIIVGFDRVGRLVADMLGRHGKPYTAIDLDPDRVSFGLERGYNVLFGDALREATMARLGLDSADAVVLTMDEPILAKKLVRKLRAAHPALPILARARDASHAAALYRAGASTAVPQTLESSLQLSEAVLVDIGVPMGPVIASIHEKRDELRAQIMEEGELEEKPKLRSTTLRERG